MPRKKTSLEEEIAATTEKLALLQAQKRKKEEMDRAKNVEVLGDVVLSQIEEGDLAPVHEDWLRQIATTLPARKRHKLESILGEPRSQVEETATTPA